ncbi:MAG: carbohydrate ABC transporter permease [Patescibacteria group bacterium]
MPFYIAISPWLIGFVFMSLLPLIIGFLTSLTNYDGLDPDYRWIGMSNYRTILGDKDAWWGLYRTAVMTVFTVPLAVIGGFLLATLLNQRVKALGFFRTAFYLPSIMPVVVMALMFRFLFDRDGGPVNALISLFRPGTAVAWLSSDGCMIVLVVMALWGMIGGGMVIYLAGLQGIPAELKEAAALDGAGAWRIFRHITVPLMTPVLFFQLIMGVIGALQTFAQPLLLTPTPAGGTAFGAVPPRSNYLFVIHAYNQIFAFNRFGYGTALLWVLFLVVLLFTLVLFKSGAYWVHYEVDQEGKGK